MMDHFIWQKETSQFFFHDQSVFQDVARFTGGGMIGTFNQDIPVRIDESTASPATIQLHWAAHLFNLLRSMLPSSVLMATKITDRSLVDDTRRRNISIFDWPATPASAQDAHIIIIA